MLLILFHFTQVNMVKLLQPPSEKLKVNMIVRIEEK